MATSKAKTLPKKPRKKAAGRSSKKATAYEQDRLVSGLVYIFVFLALLFFVIAYVKYY